MMANNPVVRLRHGVFAFLLLMIPAGLRAQTVLTGRVMTADSAALPAARVSLHDAGGKLRGETVSDSIGVFRFRIANLPAAVTFYLSVSRVGFESVEFVPVEVVPGAGPTVQVHLLQTPLEVEPVSVVGRQQRSPTLDDFYDKLDATKTGLGRGLDRDIMMRYAGLELIKALLLVPGVEDGRAMLPEGVTLTVPRMRNGCVPATFLDRMPVPPEQLAVIDPSELEGVLVYIGGHQIPAEFSRLDRGVECGMILAYRVNSAKQKSTRSLLNALLILGAFAAIATAAGR